ncbi:MULTISPECIES: hypothetical protein [Geobacillus]|jgi:hypothetical protein|uniref:Uncharacterized protein n=2 Tax=Geobacillus thermodenitrificans TaxID=33940 RepID=A0ABY9QFN5_GEOTD|nr:MULTISPECIES: hypothetical protein [Geobacillus]ARA98188.1 hypothetical protein GD3902_09220 [Geobacillus thermodenitrificans]ARP44479.1 hypothetical protein GTHT12_02985 [Geobacillus thermodenitrificans]ATO37547.1 hypothetical protein GTID1_10320 [Geobacillus thermodenitrificans]KQB91509.1 hypothetical protein GEPA3_3522 [Geobacillus sp. PA-3]MEC5188223.1 hypothetical protein [Geobacillus thermodenitrificans]
MRISDVLKYGKIGLETFGASILFFYSHLSLLLISLVPSLSRAFQMLMDESPIWLEVIVTLTRVFLFLMMISLMSKSNLNELKEKQFWDKLMQSCSTYFNKNWPYGFISQMIVFIVLLTGLGNLLIILISGLFTSTLEWLDIKPAEPTAAYDACVYFLKNMSVIPLALVYVLKMCGVKPTDN